MYSGDAIQLAEEVHRQILAVLDELGLGQEETSCAESDIVDDTKEAILERQGPNRQTCRIEVRYSPKR